VREAIPDCPEKERLATTIAFRGLGWAVRQESALALRHWWPLTAIVVVFSKTARRALATAALVDLVVASREHSTHKGKIDPITMIVGRRLEDLAYGGGLWYGALRARSVRVLMPRRPTDRARAAR